VTVEAVAKALGYTYNDAAVALEHQDLAQSA
jgi:hypothetical protein